MKSRSAARPLTLESLQSRQVLAGEVTASLTHGQLSIEGTSASEKIEVAQVGGLLQVSGVSRSFALKDVSVIRISGHGGDDNIVAPQQLDRPDRLTIVIDGGAGNDKITGSPARDLIQGGDGNDFLYGAGGDDAIGGGSGDDVINGDNGSDDLYGDDGRDHLYGQQGDDRLLGGDGSDYLNGSSGNDRIDGGRGDDSLQGGEDRDQLQGNDGDDWIFGGAGDDGIGGGSGRDVINGDEGDDWIYGDDGVNALYGNAGADRVFGRVGLDFMRGGVGLDRINGGGDDFDVFGVDDSDLRRGGVNPIASNKVEGVITAIDLTTNQVTLQTRSGEKVSITLNTSTQIERNDLHVALASLVVGDRGEAIYGNDLVASKLESSSAGGGATSPKSDDNSDDNSKEDRSNNGRKDDTASRNKIEGTVTAVNLETNQVTLQTRAGVSRLLTVNSATKIERNDRHVLRSAILVGDRGEALFDNNLVASKLESVGA